MSRISNEILGTLICGMVALLLPTVVRANNIEVLDILTQSVREMCITPDRQGKYYSVRNLESRTVQVRMKGIEGSVELEGYEWEGIRDIISERRPARECARQILPLLLEKFLPNAPSQTVNQAYIYQCEFFQNPAAITVTSQGGRILQQLNHDLPEHFFPASLMPTMYFDAKGTLVSKTQEGGYVPIESSNKNNNIPDNFTHNMPCIVGIAYTDNVFNKVSKNSVYDILFKKLRERGFTLHKSTAFSCIGTDAQMHMESRSIVTDPNHGLLNIDSIARVGECKIVY